MKKPSDDTGQIARSASSVSIAVMFSRVLGLVREQVFAVLFGAGFAYDAFVVAFRVPNLLRDLFGEGALSAAFVTVFSNYDSTRSKEETWRLAGNVLVFFSILLSIITIIGIWQAENIVRLLVESEFERTAGKVELTRMMTVIMFPFLLLISISSVFMGILNTRGFFFVPSLASGFFNIGSIIGGTSLAFILPRFGYPAIAGMAVGTLIGGLLQLTCQIPALGKAGYRFIPNLNLNDPGLRRILLLMVPAVAGLASLQLNVFINNFFASSLQEGSLSWLNYAFRLFMFPVGVFGVAISIAAHPVMARQAAKGDIETLKSSYLSTLTIAFCLTIPATVGLIVLAEPIIRIIFQHGRFDAHDTAMTSQALIYYSFGLFAYASAKITIPVFYNINNTRSPVVGSFLAVAANISIILLTIDQLHHRALALSISVAMAVNFLFLFTVLYRKMGGLSLSYLATGLCKVIVAASCMGVFLEVSRNRVSEWLNRGILEQIGALLLLIVIATGIYAIVLYLLRLKELHFIVDRLRARIRPHSH